MGKLVQANSIPFVIGGFSDITPEGERILSLDLLNRGVGPAKQRSLRVKVDDRYVTSVEKLLAASLGPELAQAATKPLNISKNNVKMRFLAPGGAPQAVFRSIKTPENAQYWDALEAAQPRWSLDTVIARCSRSAGTFPTSGKSPGPSTNACATSRTNSHPDALCRDTSL